LVFAALSDEIHHRPIPPSVGDHAAVTTMLAGDQIRNPPTWTDTLSTLISSPPHETPAITAGEHRLLSVLAREDSNLTGETHPS
jgi:hypothetical protein